MFDAVGPSTRDPVPKRQAALKTVTQGGFFGSRVRPIVISFSTFIPASTRGWCGRRPVPTFPARHR